MDRDAIRPNAPKRGLEKLCFNSLWEKLAKSHNRTKTNLISDPRDLYRFLATPGVENLNLLFASDSVVLASWRYTAEEQVPSLGHTNEVVACMLRPNVFVCPSR